jgi:hypothetical protein
MSKTTLDKCFDCGGANPFTQATTKELITLEQHQTKAALFRVTYGLQVEDNLTYTQACAKLGGAIMHWLACDGSLNNEGN